MKKLFMLCCASLLAACSSHTPSNQASLDGEVFYLQRSALPPAATLSVELQDVSLMDAPAVTLARQAWPGQRQRTAAIPPHLRPGPGQARPPLCGKRAHRAGRQAAVHKHRAPRCHARRQ
ncbi:lipoprotein [Pseudomonas putida S11]|nr:lipoprotein [Pseudomonas putida S11]